MDLKPDDRICRKPVFASRVQDDLVLFDEAAGTYFSTGTVGADIWELIEEPRTLGDIHTVLMERYDVDEATCLAAVYRFARELLDVGLAEHR